MWWWIQRCGGHQRPCQESFWWSEDACSQVGGGEGMNECVEGDEKGGN